MSEIVELIAKMGTSIEGFKAEYIKRLDVIETAVAHGQAPGGGGAIFPALSNKFAVDIQGRKIPVLARGDKMSASYPRPSGSGDWSIGEFVKGSMGIQASVLECYHR